MFWEVKPALPQSRIMLFLFSCRKHLPYTMANHTINLHANHSLLEAIYYKNFWNFLTSWRAQSQQKEWFTYVFFFFLKKRQQNWIFRELTISDEMGKGYRKRHLEIVFFSGASPLIHSHLILPEVTCLKLNLLLCCHFDDRPLIYIDQVLLGFC